MCLKQVTDQCDAHHPNATAHSTQVVGLHIRPQLELVDHQGGQRGRGAEDGAARDQDVNVLRLYALQATAATLERGSWFATWAWIMGNMKMTTPHHFICHSPSSSMEAGTHCALSQV